MTTMYGPPVSAFDQELFSIGYDPGGPLLLPAPRLGQAEGVDRA